MRPSPRILWNDERGVVLVLALILTGLLSALAAAYAMMIRADTVLRGAAGRQRHGFYAAEAGLNTVMAETRVKFEDFQIPGAASGSITVTPGANPLEVDYSLTPDETCFPCATQTIPAGQPYAGLKSIPYRYRVASTATSGEDELAALGAQFEVHSVPIFQFLAFSTSNLFIAPGNAMDLHGRLHSNGSVYLNNLGSGGIGTVSVGDKQPTMPYVQISAVNDIYRGVNKPSEIGQICSGTVTIDKLEDTVPPTPDLDPQVLQCVGNGSSPVPQATLNAYLGSLLAGVSPIQAPDMDTLARGSGVFWERADLRIVLRLDMAPAAVPFRDPDLCPGNAVFPPADPSPALFPIEIQDANGGRVGNKTRALWRLMCERRGAVFFNDVPTGAVAGNPNDALAIDRARYFPQFSGGSNARVYRQAGEDTNGDGSVDYNNNNIFTNSDINRSICPVTQAGVPAALQPAWVMDDCPWPNVAANLPLTSWYLDTDYRRGGFYNLREGQWVYMLNVNLRVLIDWNEANGGALFPPGDSSDGGLVIFLSVQGPNSLAAANNYGVRIFDSADLNSANGIFPPVGANGDPTGLTVVSDQAIYIQGNYNTRDKYPAAILGDAITVLSQGWEVRAAGGQRNDRKSVNGINVRVVPGNDSNDGAVPCGGGLPCGNFAGANALGINAAIVTGLGFAAEGPDVYNGGLENYLRMQENWQVAPIKRLNYQGSLVTLGEPQHQLNDWSCATLACVNALFRAPEQFWDYDPDFDKLEWLPPLTPMVTYVQQKAYTRFYK